jgi:UDP-N-acetylglucosamine 2-epimerase (non-hydrolysing)
MPRIDIIAGARPNFIKIAPIIAAINKAKQEGSRLQYRLIHTGQHYDSNMSGDFFTQLCIPEPDVNLKVGSGTQAEQVAAIMVRYEKLLSESNSEMCMVLGDVNSTMSCAITAQKLGVPVAHVEGGIRSGDWTMPEEINRIVTDSITNWFFTTSEQANKNLRNVGVGEDRIFFVGNTMIDTLFANKERFCAPDFWHREELQPHEYFVLTLHRPNNVDEQEKLVTMLNAIAEGTRDRKVIFPVHPRTAKMLNDIDRELPGFVYTEPMGYLEFNYLVKNCMAVITDSGGITEEATVMGVPCMTLRDTTERPETVTVGTNELVGTDPAKLGSFFGQVFDGQWKKGGVPEKWDGKTGERIVVVLEKLLHSGQEIDAV